MIGADPEFQCLHAGTGATDIYGMALYEELKGSVWPLAVNRPGGDFRISGEKMSALPRLFAFSGKAQSRTEQGSAHAERGLS